MSRNKNLRVIIAGGGTGGHVFPALAIKQSLVQIEPLASVRFVGTRHGLEASVLPRENEPLTTLWISGMARGRVLENLLLPLKLLVSLAQCAWLLARFRPHVVVGTGGYVMGPVVWLAQRLGFPTVLQEQNSAPGLTTRRLARRASVVCLGFEDAKPHIASDRVIVTGNPLRQNFMSAERDRVVNPWNLSRERRTLLVFGGSAGARSINLAVAEVLDELTKRYNVIWQTGRTGVPSITSSDVIDRATNEQHLAVREFIHDMPSAYAASDLAVCRAGAITLAELAVTGLPAILVPYPFAADDHQTANAQSVANHGAAVVIKDAELTPALLLDNVRNCLENETQLHKMSVAMKSLACPDAARQIAEIIRSLEKRS